METRSTEDELETWRVGFFNRLLVFSAAATVAAGLPILLMGDYGHAAQAGAVAVTCLLMAAARRVPLTLRLAIFAVSVASASLISIYQTAFAMPSSFIGLLFMVVFVALLRGPLWAMGFAVLSVGAIAVAGVLYVEGVLEAVEFEHNARRPASWMAVVSTTALCAILAIVGIHYFIKRFTGLLGELKSEAERRIEALEEAGRLEAQLRQSQKLEAMGALAGGVAHDFNNLLTAIMGNATLLEMQTTGSSKELSQSILDASDQAATLTRKLLAFSRHDAVEHSCVDVGQTVRGFLGLLSRLLPSTISLRIDLGDEQFCILASPSDIEAIVMNLCINARDAIGDAHGEIAIKLSGDERTVRLSIRDTGEGMEAEVLDKIFEAFYSTKDSAKGSGLGLAIVQRIMGGLGGEIRVESAPNDGAEFSLVWPRAFVEPAGSLDPTNETEPATTRIEHILVVDDDKGARDAMAALLVADGYRITVCEDGRDALIRIRELEDLDLIVTDMIMPNLSGRELLEALDNEAIDLPVLICSGYSPEIKQAIERRPNRSFLGKPYQREGLLRAVHSLLVGATSASPRA